MHNLKIKSELYNMRDFGHLARNPRALLVLVVTLPYIGNVKLVLRTFLHFTFLYLPLHRNNEFLTY